MSLGTRVLALMKDRGLSQAELARQVGLSQPAIFALIHRNKSGTKSLHRIARALGTTPAFLTGETDDPNADVPESDLSGEEREWVDLLRGVPPKDKVAILQLTRTIATSAPSQPVRSSRSGAAR